MARIRSIHPGLFTDEAFMELTMDCPLAVPLLIGLWTEADDAGVFEWKPLTIKARLLAVVNVDVRELLEVLRRVNFIERFDVDGRPFGVIRNFVKYQRPKDPKDVHDATGDMRAYAGFLEDGTRPNPGVGRKPGRANSEPIPPIAEPIRNTFGITPELGPQMEEGGCRMKDVEESLSSEVPSDPPADPKPKQGKAPYTAGFEEFWKAYPTDSLMSKKEAAKQHRLLSAADQALALAGLPAFVAAGRKMTDYRMLHACRYLSQRRWESASKPEAAAVNSGQVWVSLDGDDGAAWMNHLKATTGRYPPRDKQGGWWFPSQRPPVSDYPEGNLSSGRASLGLGGASAEVAA